MFKVIRQKGVKKMILWIVAIIIIISFGLMGQSYQLSSQDGVKYAGKIFGKQISRADFEKYYLMNRVQFQIQYGKNFQNDLPSLNLVANTWDRIILLHEAQRRRIRITNQEVIAAIQSYPFFQIDGKFSPALYQEILRSGFRFDPHQFEEGIRDTLKITRLFLDETTDVLVSDTEVVNAYKNTHEKVQVSYTLFPAEAYKNDVTFDEEKAKDYFLKNKERFIFPPMINVEYLAFNFPPPPADQPPAAKENESDGSAPKTANAWPPSSIKDEVWNKADEVRSFLAATPDLAQAAQKFNLKVQTASLNMEQPILQPGWTYPLVQKIFELKPGEISNQIEATNGYQILRVKDKQPSFAPDYEQAKDKVKEAWIKQEALQISRQKAEAALITLRKQFDSQKMPDFSQIIKDQGLEAAQTPVFTRGQYLPTIGISKEFEESAFKLDDNNPLSGVVATAKGYAIVHLDARTPIDDQQFAKDQEEFRQALLNENKGVAFTDFLASLRAKAQLEDHMSRKINNNDY